jgi:very-short-patch-repair endonuclease
VLQGTGSSAADAKLFRREMSSAEVVLWMALRARPDGLKFRRQHPSGPYVADFYCHAARLLVEADGEAHGRGDRPVRDAMRDRWFAARGLATMRVPAADVFSDCGAVVRGVCALAKDRIAREDRE